MTPRILLVDDRVAVRDTLRNVLSKFKCIFVEAESAAEALAALRQDRFEVVFLDLMLPDVNGLEVLRQRRSTAESPEKFVILTGLPDRRTRTEATELGAFRYLTKSPIDAAEVREAFTQAVYGQEAPAAGRKTVALPARPRKSRPARSHRRTNTKLPKLLILDDGADWLVTLERLLKNDFRLTLTTSPAEAYRRVRTEKFALVILDMKLLGDVSGLDVLARMRRAVQNLRAIILTEHPDPGAAFASGKQGALDYVSKSDIATLATTVRRVLTQTLAPGKVFISYDRRDRAEVLRLYNRLTAKGLLPWIDVRNIVAGRKWRPAIERAIATADFFVYCLSANSLNKEGMIQRELKLALDRQAELLDDSIFIITARLEAIDAPEPLRAFQYVDLYHRDGFANLLNAFESVRRPR